MDIEKIEITRRLAITDISTTLSQILKLKKGQETGTEIKELISAE
jgi:ribosome-associated protein YbcJ (S4-like RNA binding protein)